MGYGQMRLIGVLVGTLTVAVAAAACGSSLPGTSAQARSAGAPPTLTTPSTSPTTASSTTTAPKHLSPELRFDSGSCFRCRSCVHRYGATTASRWHKRRNVRAVLCRPASLWGDSADVS